jgi:uncharacterized protein
MIRESIITTLSAAGDVHIAPMGVIWQGEVAVLAPFRPSQTLNNLIAAPFAVINHSDDVRIFAGCLTGRRDFPVRPADRVRGAVLVGALSHQEIAVESLEEDAQRPRFRCRVVHEAAHAPFRGFNRAQAAVIEAAILVSRLEMLPFEKIEQEMAYLAIAVGKTAGPVEQEAWSWLAARVDAFRNRRPARTQAAGTEEEAS